MLTYTNTIHQNHRCLIGMKSINYRGIEREAKLDSDNYDVISCNGYQTKDGKQHKCLFLPSQMVDKLNEIEELETITLLIMDYFTNERILMDFAVDKVLT